MWELYCYDSDILSSGIENLPSLGPKRTAVFQDHGISTILDMIQCTPNRYLHRKSAIPIDEIIEGEVATISATICSVKRSPRIFSIELEDDSGRARAVFFNAPPYFSRTLVKGRSVLLWGLPKNERGLSVFTHPNIEPEGEDRELLIPIYPNADAFSSVKIGYRVRAKIANAASERIADLADPVPSEIILKTGLPSLSHAITQIHAPSSWDELESARQRLAFDELLVTQILFALRRREAEADKSAVPLRPGALFSAVKHALPYKLTDGQNHALAGLLQRATAGGRSMQLLSGDVGSGKTAIAMLVAAAAVDSGLQVALMVPSTLLARQHAELLDVRIGRFGVGIGLLTGSSRSESLEKAISEGKVDIVVGTQALLSKRHRFKNLGLVIIDEQHRFGVNQRLALTKKSGAHVLLMSATPIPRTSALALYGDLDLEVLHGFPSERAGFRTFIREEDARPAIWNFIERKIESGERVFIVHPRIEGGDFTSIKKGFDAVSARFPGLVSIVHGSLSDEKKESAFASFRTGETPILASTSVIEVGVDIPEATVMVVENPESFGLAQLHQLRGRIGRGGREGFCILIARSAKDSPARKRIELFASTSDGFEISEIDLEFRGEGQVFDFAQSGKNLYIFSDPLKMPDLLDLARKYSLEIVADDPELTKKKNFYLRNGIKYLCSTKNIVKLAV